MMPISRLADRLGMTASLDPTSGMLRLSSDRGTVIFNPRFHGIVVGDEVLFRGYPVVIEDDEVSVPPGFIDQCEKLLRPKKPARRSDPSAKEFGFHVVLDPGHGGHDPGAIGASGNYEKTVNLAVARLIEQELEAARIRVTLTRTGDVFVDLNERAAIGNRLRADAFVSIHADATTSPTVSGFTVYVCHTKYTEAFRADLIALECGLDVERCRRVLASNRSRSRSLAERIRDEMSRATRATDRGVQLGELRVLSRSLGPAVLVELGYMSNPAEERRLVDPAYQRALATAIAQGIIAFLKGG